MTDSYDVAIQGLIRKRAEIAGRIEVMNDQLTQALVDIDHVDCCLRLLDPAFQPEGIPSRAPVAPFAVIKGQTTRVILAMLREQGPLTTQEITVRLVEARKLNSSDKTLVRTINARAGSALRKLRERGLIVSTNTGGNGLLRWQLASEFPQKGDGLRR